MTRLQGIVDYLDRALDVAAFADASHNGLQVENAGRVRHVCAGVDASMAFFEAAAERGADLLICHHGLSWDDSLRRITGMNYRRLKFLLDHGMALYACHLPLDAHPRLGHNACIARAFGLRNRAPFGTYHGRPIGLRGSLPTARSYAAFKKQAWTLFGRPGTSMDFGPARIRTVAVVSGGAADLVEEAADAGVDVFVTGEPKLSAWHTAQERGVNILFAGHYATETFGVKAVADRLARRFTVRAEFLDLAVPF
jgi:dinuclear metal center YbgI/SA1388 family protein